MANYYRSWTCADLDNATLYSSDATENPDWYAVGDICPLAKCVGYDILNHFDTYIQESFQTGVVWTSPIIMIANYTVNGVTQSRGPCIRFATYFEGGNGYLRVTVGYGDHTSITGSKTKQYTEADYLAFPTYRRKIYIVRKLLRSSYADQGAPNYSGYVEYSFWFGGVQLRIGTWDSTYNQMRYNTVVPGVGDPAACLLSTPCTNSTKRDQSEGVYEINSDYCPYFNFGRGETGANLTDASGGYDPDPPDPTGVDPNAVGPGYPSGPGGGGGDHNPDSDDIEVPALPGVSALNTGFLTLYFGNTQMIHAFLSNLWVSSTAQAIKNFFQQPMDFIAGAMILPLASQLTAAQDGTASPVFNNEVFDSALPYTDTQFFEVDCGTLDMDEYWGSCFDFDPYTKITIWLPFIGYRDLLADEVMGHSIYVKYHIDALTGDCVAFVGVSAVGPQGPDITKILAQYSGNCGVQIPISGQSFDALVSSTINMLTSVTGFGLSAKLGGGSLERSQAGGAFSSLTNSAVSVVTSSKPDVQRSGAVGASSGMMGSRTPYIIKHIPRQSLPENYQEMKGYPSNVYATLSQLGSGYAEVDDIQLNNIPAMEDERKEIMELLRGGVLL